MAQFFHLQKAVNEMDNEMDILKQMNNEERWNSMFDFESTQRGRKINYGGKVSLRIISITKKKP